MYTVKSTSNGWVGYVNYSSYELALEHVRAAFEDGMRDITFTIARAEEFDDE